MTRTVAIGEPAGWQREIYQIVADAQAAGVGGGAAGRRRRPMWTPASRDLIRGRPGTASISRHGLGHGVGLEIHEAPIIGYGRTGTLADRVPITIEPGIYLPGRGGVRIEDTLVVRAGAGAAGSAQPLTTITRELLVLSRPPPAGRLDVAVPPACRRATNVATTNDLKNGMTLSIDGQLWNVVEFQHVKPGKGGAFVRTKLKNVMSGKVVDRTFNAGVKVDVANVDKRRDAVPVPRGRRSSSSWTCRTTTSRGSRPTTVGDGANYLLEEQTVTVAFNEGVAAVRGPAASRRADRQPDRSWPAG